MLRRYIIDFSSNKKNVGKPFTASPTVHAVRAGRKRFVQLLFITVPGPEINRLNQFQVIYYTANLYGDSRGTFRADFKYG